ncbi:putative cytochrome p450 family protein [Curvularia clavata]|uniref:Cytochrome p450 family protein n=1 Tax=Curvularia clavata TaxID=95742 RepID=A0A9Q8ZGP6_CURCL|nr:putative cytochrome p450 family protein [Curvularia clavata]
MKDLIKSKDLFIIHIAAGTAGDYQLLILDSYSSHATPEFDWYCVKNKIITLYMPPYTSHLLEPLYEYLPFNERSRICIGQQFAVTEAGYVVVRLPQKFDMLEWMGLNAEPAYRMTLTCSPADGVKLRLREAKL